MLKKWKESDVEARKEFIVELVRRYHVLICHEMKRQGKCPDERKLQKSS